MVAGPKPLCSPARLFRRRIRGQARSRPTLRKSQALPKVWAWPSLPYPQPILVGHTDRLVNVGIESEGPVVLIAMRDQAGHRATLEITRRGAGPMAATLALVASDDGPDCELVIRGTLQTATPATEYKP